MKRNNKVLVGALIGFTSLVNILVILIGVQLYQGIDDLNDHWRIQSISSLKKSSLLTEIERSFGYEGFIHHFKNYVIRRDPNYIISAEQRYGQVKSAINELRGLSSSVSEQLQLNRIESTLDDYFKKLQRAQEPDWVELSPESLDKLVKVDDSRAAEAFNVLRKSLLPNSEESLQQSWALSGFLYQRIFAGSAILLPMLLIAGLITPYSLTRFNQLYRRLKLVLDSSPDAIIYANEEGDIIQVNRAALRIFGYTLDEFKYLKVEDLIAPEMRISHKQHRKDFNEKESMRVMGKRNRTIHGLTRDGKVIKLDIAISSFKVGNAMHNIAVARDISQQLELEQHANKDHLTGLANRRAIDEVLDKELSRAERYGRSLATLLIDIDSFKRLNDQLGHVEGDKALTTAAEYLQTHIRPSDCLGRWGGDEFILICPELSAEGAESLAERIREGFEEIGKQWNPPVTLSIGVHWHKGQVRDVYSGDLVSSADEALYQAKNNGKNQVSIHTIKAN